MSMFGEPFAAWASILPPGLLHPMQSQYFSKVADDFYVLPLQHVLNSKPGLWGRRNFRKASEGSPHSGMTDIWARYRDFSEMQDWDKFRFTPFESVWYPESEEIPQVRPLVFKLMAAVEGERLGAVLITKLPPGGRIEPHTDSGWHAENHSKFYIPIQNGEGANFHWEDGFIAPKLGEVWRFDNSVPHWVTNDSDTDRISLIVCIKTDMFKP